MKLAELMPAPYNPRRISDRALKALGKSVERFGLVEPIVWNKQTGNVVGGHQRLKVLEEQGYTECDIVVVDLSEVEEKALNLTLNNPEVQGEFTDLVSDIIDQIQLELPDAFADLLIDHIPISVDDALAEWESMPEYESKDVGPDRQLIVSFRNDDDVQAFAKLVDQKITDKTRSLWYPLEPHANLKNLHYIDDDGEVQ